MNPKTEKVGFEPTVPFGITGFQDQLLKPLGHLSKCVLDYSTLSRAFVSRSFPFEDCPFSEPIGILACFYFGVNYYFYEFSPQQAIDFPGKYFCRLFRLFLLS